MHERAFDDLLELYRWEFGIEDPSLLDWTPGMRVRPRITDAPARDERPDAPARNTVIFGPVGERLTHPDNSLNIVVLDEHPSAAALAEARRVARDAVVVWARDGAVSVEWLRTRVISAPAVSVVVIGAGEGERRAGCLRSISETTPVTDALEVLVADTINAGADAARAELLVIVDEHTRVLPGWLRPLARTLRDTPEIGVAGAKLLATDGTVDSAGGVLFADGSVAGYGHGLPDPRAPLLGYERDVPYISAGLLATRRGLLQRLGGVVDAFGAGHADVDYCLRVRAAGRRVVYQPQSVAVRDAVVVDAEAASAARARFVRRWATPLAAFPTRPERFDAATWERLALSS